MQDIETPKATINIKLIASEVQTGHTIGEAQGSMNRGM